MTQSFGFGNVQKNPTLEDLYGASTARQAEFGGYVNQQFPGINGNFRNFLDQRAPSLNRSFGLNDIIEGNPSLTFAKFLQSRLPGGRLTGTNSRSELNIGANKIRGGPLATGLTNSQRSAIEAISSNPRAQFDMALDPQISALAGRFRPAFGNLTDRRFDSMLAENGTQPNFNVLPHLQDRNFNFF